MECKYTVPIQQGVHEDQLCTSTSFGKSWNRPLKPMRQTINKIEQKSLLRFDDTLTVPVTSIGKLTQELIQILSTVTPCADWDIYIDMSV